ncbi:hypothetical protein Lal_00049360, partial [Lupinus albus]
DGTTLSRLDIFFISLEWAIKWPSLVKRGLKRLVSDQYGPKTFRVLNAWFKDKDFVTFVEQKWVGEFVDLSDDDVLKRSNLWEDLWQTRTIWIKDGDSNSKYFHRLVNVRRRNNNIHGFQINGIWIEDVKGIKNGVLTHFQTLFSHYNLSRPIIGGVPFRKIDHSNNAALITSFDDA